MPLFSIITITYNNLAGLKKTHESLMMQTCRDFEWHVVDGASTDGTKKFLESLTKTSLSSLSGGSIHPLRENGGIDYPDKPDNDDNNFINIHFTSTPDHGIYDAMNKGIERAQGDYLLFLNAGDILAKPDVLEKIAQRPERPALIYGDALEEISGGSTAYKPARSHTKITRALFTHHQAILYRRESIKDLRYDLRYKIAADYDFTLRFLKRNNNKALHHPIPICLFESGGISQQQTRQGRHEQFEIRKRILNQNPLKNYLIVGKQVLIQTIKNLFPKLYWLLRNIR